MASDLEFSLGGYSPEEYFEAVQNHTQEVLASVEEELQVEETIAEQTKEIENLDKGIVEDLKEVLQIFSEYLEDMEKFTGFVVNKVQNEGINDSGIVYGALTDAVASGELDFDHGMQDVLQKLQVVHNDLKDAYQRLKKKDEDLRQISNELQDVVNEDRDLEEELTEIEHMVDHMADIVMVYEETTNDIDPSNWDFSQE